MRRIIKNRRLHKRLYIYQMLEKQGRNKHISFHTPGHKDPKWDITELSYSDNLSCPRGVILQAEQDASKILGAEKSFLLTDGSTCGVLSMLHAAKSLGAKTVFAREDSHKSLYNACALLGIELLLLETKTQNGIPLPVEKEDLDVGAFSRADVLFLTSPDYYGNIANLKSISALCKTQNKLLIIDGAHGGHLHFDKTVHAGAYADFWVDGVHKSLPALTQGAVVSAKTETGAKALAKAVDIFRTTSPSYPIMASVEYAVKYPRNESLEKAAREFETQTDRVYFGGDWTKLCCVFGKAAFVVEKRLQKEGIFAEFCDGNIVCFYLSPATKTRDFNRLKKRLQVLFDEYPLDEGKTVQRSPAPLIFDKKQVEWVEIEESVCRVSAGSAGLFPPCVPLIKDGELITKEHVEKMKNADNVFGVVGGKIAVYKKEE